jgi:hypothetical protein
LVVLIRRSPHPYSALLFIDWSLSEEGQTRLTEAAGRISIRKGIKHKPWVQELFQKDFVFLSPSSIGPNRNAIIDQYNRAIVESWQTTRGSLTRDEIFKGARPARSEKITNQVHAIGKVAVARELVKSLRTAGSRFYAQSLAPSTESWSLQNALRISVVVSMPATFPDSLTTRKQLKRYSKAIAAAPDNGVSGLTVIGRDVITSAISVVSDS